LYIDTGHHNGYLFQRVMATRRSAGEGDRVRHVDDIIPMNRLPELLSNSDFVVMALPSTPGTEQMVGDNVILFPHVSGRRADFDVVKNDFFLIISNVISRSKTCP